MLNIINLISNINARKQESIWLTSGWKCTWAEANSKFIYLCSFCSERLSYLTPPPSNPFIHNALEHPLFCGEVVVSQNQ